MKKKFILGLAFAALAAGGCLIAGSSSPRHQFTPEEIANIEALSGNEGNVQKAKCQGSCMCICVNGPDFIIHGHLKFIY